MSRLKTAAVVAAATAAFIGGWEGKRLIAYRDIAGVWTVCYGETQGVKPNDRYTDAECKAMLMRRLEDYAEPVERCLPGLPDGRFIAFVSHAYNFGPGKTCNSTAANLIRRGRIKEGCDALMAWNKAWVGGLKKVESRGLTNRRAAERALCLKGVL